MREQSIDEQRVDGDGNEGDNSGQAQGHGHRNRLVNGIGVLQGDVFEGERLVEGFDGIENVEAGDTGAVVLSSQLVGSLQF